MKKITAVCLFVVCLLCANIAFAWNWTCPSTAKNCGKIGVEVLPYVKVNDGCGGFTWSRSDCAAAVSSEYVYFLVRLSIPRDIDPIWYKYTAATTLSFAKGGFTGTENSAVKATAALPCATVDDLKASFPDKSEDGWEFYAYPAAAALQSGSTGFTGDVTGFTFGWLPAAGEDFTELSSPDPTSYMWGAKIVNSGKAKLCAELTSNFSGTNEWLTFGDYKIYFDDLGPGIGMFDAMIFPACVDTKKVDPYSIYAPSYPDEYLTLLFVSGMVDNIDSKVKPGSTFAQDAIDFFGIRLGTCITPENVKENFGWKEKIESCFTWSGNGTALIDVQCEVDIPKTGDKPLLALTAVPMAIALYLLALRRIHA